MQVVINGQDETVTETTLEELCKRFNEDPSAVATAVNGDFVALQERSQVVLQAHDRIEILSPRSGG